MILRLTFIYSDGDQFIPVAEKTGYEYINFNFVSNFYRVRNHTILKMGSEEYRKVIETPEKIMEMIMLKAGE